MGFARTESTEVTYIATTNELNIEEEVDVIPRNWIPKRKWERKTDALKCAQATTSDCSESSQNRGKSQAFQFYGRTKGIKPIKNQQIRRKHANF